MQVRRTSRGARAALLASALLGGSACSDSGPIVEIRATGAVLGLAFLDRNGNGVLETADGPVPGIAVRLQPPGSGTVSARAVTGTNGGILLTDLAVGDYNVVVESATVPDSLVLVQVKTLTPAADTTRVRVTAGDTASVQVVLSYPTVSVRQARTLPTGKRVAIDAVTLNAFATYGDSTLHVTDSSGVIRATRVASSTVSSGQRVRLVGTTDVRNGQRTLTDGIVFPVSSTQLPPPVAVSTATAARADGGVLDAALVRVSSAAILSGLTNTTGDFALTVTDGSGTVEVVLDRDAGISATPYVPGGVLTATGVLVPSDGNPGTWQLKPRSASDLSVTFPTATIAEARQLQAGRTVTIEAVALNAWATYADSTVHIADATGSMRAVRVTPANLFGGDRVRMLGTIVFRDGQPVLSAVQPTVLGTGVLPLPQQLNSGGAATADGGRLDAALVKVVGSIVADTLTSAGDFRLNVDTGNGLLEVLLDRDSGFQLAPFQPGSIVDVTGLLVPTVGGRDWRLKPRQQSDVAVLGLSTTTVAQARALPPGSFVSVEGVALNTWATFGDSTVHITGAGAGIRSTRVRSSSLAIGSRVRLLGTIELRDGQPTLTNATPALLSTVPGPVPLPETVTGAAVGNAGGGVLDAQLVRVNAATITDTLSVAGGDRRLTLTDASGLFTVLLDREAGFNQGQFTPTRVLDVTGLLVPIPGQGVWMIKPRQASDVVFR